MPRICVLGSANMDLVVRAPRLPAPGETLLGGAFATFPGGKGANQAVAARRAGGEVCFLGALGEDDHGRALRAALGAEGIELALALPGGPSGVALITVEEAGENTIVVAAGANGLLSAAHVDLHREAIETADLLVAQLEVPLDAVERAAHRARGARVPVLLNAAPAMDLPASLLELVDLVVVNRVEAAALGDADPEAPPAELVRTLRDRGLERGVLTLGSAGARSWRGDEQHVLAAFPVASRDAVAAGDAFVGNLALALAEGRDDREALRRASAAGALATLVHGAQPSLPRREQLEAFLARHPE